MAMDPDIIKATEILKRLKLRINGTLIAWNDATQSFDVNVSGADTETAFSPQLDADADLLLDWATGGTNNHSPTLKLVKGGNNTRFGVDGSGNLGWQAHTPETTFSLTLGSQLDRIADVTAAGTNGHSPTLEMTPGANGTFLGVTAGGLLAWMGLGESFSFTDTTVRSYTYSGGAGPFNTAQTNMATFTNPSAAQTLKLMVTHGMEFYLSNNVSGSTSAVAVMPEISQDGGGFAMPNAVTGFDHVLALREVAGTTISWTQLVTLAPSASVTFRARGRFMTPSANVLGKTITQPASGSRFDVESYYINAVGVFA